MMPKLPRGIFKGCAIVITCATIVSLLSQGTFVAGPKIVHEELQYPEEARHSLNKNSAANFAVRDEENDDDERTPDSQGEAGQDQDESEQPDKTCEAASKIIFIPTQTAATSHIVGMLQRYSLRHGLQLGLPKDLSSLGWPLDKNIEASLANPDDVIDIIGTGRLRYTRHLPEFIVPEAKRVTVLQESSSQMKLTWKTLEVETYMQKSSQCQSLEGFLEERQTCSKLLPSDIPFVALENPQAYDLGLAPSASFGIAKDMVEQMELHFDMVLIAEHFDESLVLMARKFCWNLADVVYLADRLTLPSPDSKLAQEADSFMYRTFNDSLWEQIGEHGANFQRDLRQFRALRAATRDVCDKLRHSYPAQVDLFAPATQLQDCLLHSISASQFHKLLLAAKPEVQPKKTSTTALQTTKRSVPYIQGDKSCKPWNKVVWIKTHKTGSSTVTNIMHRAALKYKAKVVIPIGDLFLGWPNGKNVGGSFVYPLPGLKTPHTFDFFCSAHHRYNREVLQELLPLAKYVTLLRHPVSHFISSWSYWGIGGKLASRGPKKCASWQYYLDNRPECDAVATKFDVLLMHNSMTFDLGLEVNSSVAEVEALTEHLKTDFSMVLITEYMDASLLLMKRQFCWDLEDVAYYAMKVSRKNKPQVEEKYQNAIMSYNSNDKIAYEALNKTLWDKIAQEPGFFEELEELQRLKTKLVADCSKYGTSENVHLFHLIDKKDQVTPEEKSCRLATMDSRGFSKYLKYTSGLLPSAWCAKSPQKKILLLPVQGTSRLPGKLLTRHGITHGKRVGVPLDYESFGFPNAEDAVKSYFPPWKHRRRVTFEIMSLGTMRHVYEPHIRPIIPHAKHVAVIRPIMDQFLWAWDHLNLSETMPEDCNTLTSFSNAWQNCLKHISEPFVIRNPIAFAFGYDIDEQPNVLYRDYKAIDKLFPTIIFEERLTESLLLMQRVFCLPLSDMDFLPESNPLTSDVQAEYNALSGNERKQIANSVGQMNSLDRTLRDHFYQRFTHRLRAEVSFATNAEEMDARSIQLQTDCKKYESESQDDHLVVLLANQTTVEERHCRMLLADGTTLGKYVVANY